MTEKLVSKKERKTFHTNELTEYLMFLEEQYKRAEKNEVKVDEIKGILGSATIALGRAIEYIKENK